MTTAPTPSNKKRIFLLTVFPDAAHPPLVKEIFEVSDLEDALPGVRQFLINMPPVGGGVTTIKELY